MRNLKVGQLLYFSFGLIIALSIALGTLGAVFTCITNRQYIKTVTPCTEAFDYLTDAWLYYDDLKYYAELSVNAKSEEIAARTVESAESCFDEIEENMQSLVEKSSEINFNEEALNALELADSEMKTLLEMQKELVESVKAGDVEKAEGINAEILMGDLTSELEENLDIVYYSINDLNIAQMESCTKNAYVFVTIIVAIIIAAAIVGIAFSMYITKMVKGEIYKIKSVAEEVSNGNLNVSLQCKYHNEFGELENSISNIVKTFKSMLADISRSADKIESGSINYKIDADNYSGDYKEVIEAINYTTGLLTEDLIQVVNTVSDYAEGNFSNKVKRFNGEKAFIHEKIDTVQKNLIDITDDIDRLIESVLEGKLSIRMNAENYHGDWKLIAEGFNKLMVAVNEPVSEVSKILSLVAKANFNESVEGEYSGEFAEMKQSVNTTIENNSSYINEISSVLTEMSNNNLDISIDREYIGDYAAIKTAIERILQSFNNVLKDISRSAEEIMNGSKQIAESSMMLADGATSQAVSVQNLTSSINSILESVTGNSKLMKKSNEFAIVTKEKAFESKGKMDDMIEAMNAISQASGKISSIIKDISDIAFQTNILALNAAVEAARAGEAGKGFAVVADEIGNLASRSQKAAQNTAQLISDVVDKVGVGTDIASDTVTILDEVVNDVQEIAEVILESVDSSQAELNSVETISKEIDMINSVTHTNSASSQESAAASEELASQAELFSKMLNEFKIRK